MSHNRIETLSAKVCAEYDADLLFYFGEIKRPKDDFLVGECPKKKKHKNLILMLGTFGGCANAGYRIMRTLQLHYCSGPNPGKLYAAVNSVCASAGTLMVTGADELLLSDHAELGPIDVQLQKADEIGERTSGLTPMHALEYLEDQGLDLFDKYFSALRFTRGFPTNLAAKIATDMTSGLIGRLYEQIDPIRVAEVNRSVRIAADYGERIRRNLKAGALERLLRGYPSHDFVIDRTEAGDLFNKITIPSDSLQELGILVKPEIERWLYSPGNAKVAFFEPPVPAPTPTTPPPTSPVPAAAVTPAKAKTKPATPHATQRIQSATVIGRNIKRKNGETVA